MRRRAAVSIHARLERVRVVRCGMAQHRYEYPDTVKEVTHPHDTRLRSSSVVLCLATHVKFRRSLLPPSAACMATRRQARSKQRCGRVLVHLGSVVSYKDARRNEQNKGSRNLSYLLVFGSLWYGSPRGHRATIELVVEMHPYVRKSRATGQQGRPSVLGVEFIVNLLKQLVHETTTRMTQLWVSRSLRYSLSDMWPPRRRDRP